MDSTALRDNVVDDIKARSAWATKQEQIILARMCDRPDIKTYPYEGAPNYVDPIIDDSVRDKTDQEISMLWNTTRICHAAPLSPVDPSTRVAIESAFDCYLRYIIKIRSPLETAMDAKNQNGFVVIKAIRKYNDLLKQDVPDIEVKEIFDIIVPPDTKHIQSAPRICDVLKEDERSFWNKMSALGVDEETAGRVWRLAKKEDGDRSNSEKNESYYEKVKELAGLATSKGVNFIVLWAIYHYADDDDVAWIAANGDDQSVETGDKIVTLVCPDCPEEILIKYPWRERDVMEPVLDESGMTILDEAGQPVLSLAKKGADRRWPFVQPRYENRCDYFYMSRGIGEICMDDQVEATANKNAKYIQLDYYSNPIFKGISDNTGNVTLAPGSSVDRNVEVLSMPQVSQQFDFNSNACRATASRRVGATGMFNFSQQATTTRKVQKSATEVQSENANAASLSSCSVDRFNEPLGELFQMLWEDMARMKLQFPVFTPVDGVTGQVGEDIYSSPVVLVPASSAKTLNPDGLLSRMMAFIDFMASKMQAGVPFDIARACSDVAAQFDSRLTRDWIIDPNKAGPQGQPPIYQILSQLQQQIQLVAQGGKDLSGRVQNVEKLAVETADNVNPQPKIGGLNVVKP